MQNRVALVTGAGSGIGRDTALRLAQRGCRLVLGDINSAAAEVTAEAVCAEEGRALPVALDVSLPASVQAFVDTAVESYGQVDYLVNCAGVWERVPLTDLSEAAWDRMLAINLKGTFLCCQAVAPHMIKVGTGAIVNVASIAGRMGGNWCGVHYAASKGGVVALTMHMARELGPLGVRVNAVAPGIVETPMTAVWPAEIMQGIVSRTPIGRLGRSDDLADAIVFLLSEEARFVVGEILEVNGGLFTH